MRAAVNDFHRLHPEVWTLFERFALEAASTGRRRFGVAAVWERLRWETAVNPDYASHGEWKLNNNYRAFYARRFMRAHPEHAGFFATRRQTSKAA
jgi:hypothetical protein